VLRTLPRITRILAEAKEGLPQALLSLRGSGDPDAKVFVHKYDSVSRSDRRYRIGSNWEAIAFAAGLDPRRLFGVAVDCLLHDEETVAQIIAATAHPLVVKRSVEHALAPGGWRDRHDLMAARGFHPGTAGLNHPNRDPIILGRKSYPRDKAK
jgi:hypothetical protein